MVCLSRLLCAKRQKMRNFLRVGFMDSLRVRVVGGSGGTGLPKYGGLGGAGGSVACVGAEFASLNSIKRQYPESFMKAGNGENSLKNMILGTPGADIKLEVPVGLTLIHDTTVLGEINEIGQQIIVALGGVGGGPKNGWVGLEGEAKSLELELRLIADVGLLGFPNAGKSTLLRAVSRAKPKIASYPFTTVRPNIGAMEYPDLRLISMADLPGLVEGAHLNIGMGHKFLRHVERTKLIVMIVDINGFSLSAQHKHRTCLENILLLNKELELYNPELLSKPIILVVNKMDTPNAENKFEKLLEMLDNLEDCKDKVSEGIWPQELIQFLKVISISAKESSNISELKNQIRQILDDEAEKNLLLEVEKELPAFREKLHSRLRERGPQLT